MSRPGPPTPESATPQERKRNPFTRSATGGRVLSALMLPFFAVRPPAGFGVLTTTGRRTGKTRRKCVRVVHRGTEAYIVMLGPALLGRAGPGTTSAWLLNIRANPRVRLRLRGGTFAGIARELEEGPQKEQAREAYCETVHPFDYLECDFHLGGRATRAKIKQLHRHWFETGVPLVVELADDAIELSSIGRVESALTDLAAAPNQGDEGAPEARLVLVPGVLEALDGIAPGDRIIVLTWLDRARRDVLRVHPRGDPANPMQGVFATRSPDRPNPIGLHEVDVLAVDGASLRVRPLEAVHGTPIVDIKPVLTPRD